MDNPDAGNLSATRMCKSIEGKGKYVFMLSQKEKGDMIGKDKSVIILCLGNKSLTKVAREKTTTEIWIKLESLYMTKLLT